MSKSETTVFPRNLSALRIFWGQLRRSDRSGPEKDRVRALKYIPLFEHLRRHELEEVAKIMFEREYQEDEYLFEMGQPGEALFILLSGEIVIEVPHGDSLQAIARLAKNSFVGELALMDASPRSASARAITGTKALALFRSDLDNLMESHPKIAARIYQALATIIGNRLKATNELIEKQTLKAVA